MYFSTTVNFFFLFFKVFFFQLPSFLFLSGANARNFLFSFLPSSQLGQWFCLCVFCTEFIFLVWHRGRKMRNRKSRRREEGRITLQQSKPCTMQKTGKGWVGRWERGGARHPSNLRANTASKFKAKGFRVIASSRFGVLVIFLEASHQHETWRKEGKKSHPQPSQVLVWHLPGRLYAFSAHHHWVQRSNDIHFSSVLSVHLSFLPSSPFFSVANTFLFCLHE